MITVEEAITIFKNTVDEVRAEVITEFDSAFYVSNSKKGDFGGEEFLIDKQTGNITSLDFAESMEFFSRVDDTESKEHKL